MSIEVKAGLMIGLYWGVVALNLIALILNIRTYRRLTYEKNRLVSQRLHYYFQAEQLDKELDSYFVLNETLKKRLFEQDFANQRPARCHDAAGHFSKEFYEYIDEKWRREDEEDDRAENDAPERDAD